jgi:integrase
VVPGAASSTGSYKGPAGYFKGTSEARSLLERVGKRAGLGTTVGSEWHLLRHTYATHAAMLGVNAWALKRWMGHKRLEETESYVSIAEAHKREKPDSLLVIGAKILDPDLRVIAMMSARVSLAA